MRAREQRRGRVLFSPTAKTSVSVTKVEGWKWLDCGGMKEE